ncbi:MAG: hypothetical protein HY420_00700 [Candidatus Kerfeldbacteria bacterium]|nr:hypothetical protein [Candidatus Kerfeldbacteria bacterium]
MKRLRNTKVAILIVSLLFSWSFPPQIIFASSQTQLSQTINAGTLGVDIVDASNVTVGSPSVAFSAVTFNFDTVQNSTGTLGASSQKIRLSNGRSAPAVAWNLTVAAASGATALWSDGGSNTFDFNGSSAQGRLTVDASVGTITPTNSYTSTGLSKGSSTSFAQGTTDSITLLSASTSADQPGRWDFTGVGLTQTIPAFQTPAAYTLSLALTAT